MTKPKPKRVSPGAMVQNCTFTRNVAINGDVLKVLLECANVCGAVVDAVRELTMHATDGNPPMLVIGDTEDKA